MPNGVDVPIIPIPLPLPEFPGPSFGDVFRAIGSFFGFGGGANPPAPAPVPLPPVFIERQFSVGPLSSQEQLREFEVRARRGITPTPIPTPAEGGPPLVTERFEALPGPFVPEPDIPILQELGIPFPELQLEAPGGRIGRFRPIPEPDVLEEEMAVDAPLLAGVGGLPAIFQRTTPIIGGVLGGLAQDLVSGFLRAPQELGAAQIPARLAQVGRLCPPERPSTRILRQIQAATGVRVKLSAAKAIARQLGLQNAARCLGITITEVCTLIITPSPRRRRGISGSDIRIVKRTARRFQGLQEDLSGLVSRRRAAPRRRRHVHALQHTAPAP